jgi:hypothetical protein
MLTTAFIDRNVGPDRLGELFRGTGEVDQSQIGLATCGLSGKMRLGMKYFRGFLVAGLD